MTDQHRSGRGAPDDTPGPFVSSDWLAARLDDPDVSVVDVREPWEYEGIGHVPGAANVPFELFHDRESGGGLPDRDRWCALLGEAGVGVDDTLVAYDDTHGVFAARFLVTAEVYGHRDRRLLDGDYSAWARDQPVSTATPTVDPTAYDPPEPAETPLVDYETVREIVGDGERTAGSGRGGASGEWVVLDTREPVEFASGHLPGAVRLDWRELVDEERRGLRPREELERVLADHGATPGRGVLLYCNTARRISHTYLVLRHLGYERVAFYQGSLADWESRGGPVARDG